MTKMISTMTAAALTDRLLTDDEPLIALLVAIKASGNVVDELADDDEVDAADGLTYEEMRELRDHLTAATNILDVMFARVGRDV